MQALNCILQKTMANGSNLVSRSYSGVAAALCSSTFPPWNTYSDKHIHCLDIRTPMVQSVRRQRSNLNMSRPHIPNKYKAIVLKLTHEKYKYPLEGLPVTETCINAVKEKYTKAVEPNPYELILAKELREAVEEAQMVLVMARHSCKSETFFDMKIMLHRIGFKYIYHNTKVMTLAVTDTKYQNLIPLYMPETITFVGDNKDIAKVLKVERKMPYLMLLACVVEGRIMSVDDMKAAAALPGLDDMRATLLQTLGAQAQQLSRNLTHHQTELCGSLKRYSDGLETTDAAATEGNVTTTVTS